MVNLEKGRTLESLVVMDLIEADLQGRGHQGPVVKQLEVPILPVSAMFVTNYMGVFVVRPLEPATIMESLDTLLEIVLEHLDLLSGVHRQSVRVEIKIELVLLITITQ